MRDDRTTDLPVRPEQRVDLPAGFAARIGPDTCVAYVCRLRLGERAYYPGTLARQHQWLGAAVAVSLVEAGGALSPAPTHVMARATAPRARLTSGAKWPERDE